MDGFDLMHGLLGLLVVVWIIGGVLIFYDSNYIRPIAADNANDYCEARGFDQHKSFDRVGLFSENPVAIKCEYAERYTDLGVRTTVGGN